MLLNIVMIMMSWCIGKNFGVSICKNSTTAELIVQLAGRGLGYRKYL